MNTGNHKVTNQPWLPKSGKTVFYEDDQITDKQRPEEAVTDSWVLLIKNVKYNTEKYSTKNAAQIYKEKLHYLYLKF